MQSDLAISRKLNVKLAKRKCWTNEQYSRREFLEISSILEPVSALEDKIQGVLRGIVVEVDSENIESYLQKERKKERKGNERQGRPKTFEERESRQNKIKQEKIEKYSPYKDGSSSGTKVFITKNPCGYYKLLWLVCKKLFLEKKIASFLATNVTVKIKLLSDQPRPITH